MSLRAWLVGAGRSAVLRGSASPLRVTAPTLADYQNALTGGGGQWFEQLLSTRFPHPTDVTVELGVAFGTGGVLDALVPRFYAIPPVVGSPFSPGYADVLGAFVVSWGMGAYQFQAIVDLGAGTLSLPGVDSVTVAWIASGAGVAGIATVAPTSVRAGVLPGCTPGSFAVCSRVPMLVAPASTNFQTLSQQFARDWRASFAAAGVAFPVAAGPIVVRRNDNLAAVDSAEVVELGSVGGFGARAADSTWIPTSAGVFFFDVHNLGPVDVNVKVSERIMVG